MLQCLAHQKICEAEYKGFQENKTNQTPEQHISRFFTFCKRITPRLEAIRALEAGNAALPSLEEKFFQIKSAMKEQCITLLTHKARLVSRLRDTSKIEQVGELFTQTYSLFGDGDPRVQRARTAILESQQASQELLGYVVHNCLDMDHYSAQLARALFPSTTFSSVDEIISFAIHRQAQTTIHTPRR